MTEQAFNDQCTGANPRYPLMSEIKELYLDLLRPRAPGLRRLLVFTRFFAAGVHGCFTHPRRRFYRIVERMQPCCYPIPRPSSSAVATRSFMTWATQIVKVFNETKPVSDVFNEALNLARINECGIRSPKALEVSQLENANGWALRDREGTGHHPCREDDCRAPALW